MTRPVSRVREHASSLESFRSSALPDSKVLGKRLGIKFRQVAEAIKSMKSEEVREKENMGGSEGARRRKRTMLDYVKEEAGGRGREGDGRWEEKRGCRR